MKSARRLVRKTLVNAVIIVSFDAGGLWLPSPPEAASEPTEKKTTGAYCEIEMIYDDKIVNVIHRCCSP